MANTTGYDRLTPTNPNATSVSRQDLPGENTIYLFDPTVPLKNFNLTGNTSDGDNIAINALSTDFTVRVKNNVITLTGLKKSAAEGLKVTASLKTTGATTNFWFADGMVNVEFTPKANGRGGHWEFGDVRVKSKLNLNKHQKYDIDASKTFATAEAVINENLVTHALTPAVGEILIGTSGNDTFKGVLGSTELQSTLNMGDEVNGLGGIDRMNLIIGTGVSALPTGISFKNVEIFNITNGSQLDINAENFEGVTQIWQSQSAGNLSNVQSTTTVGFRGAFTDPSVDIKLASGAASANIALDKLGTKAAGGNANIGVDFFSLNIEGDKLSTVTISGTTSTTAGGDDVNLSYEIHAGKDVDTLTVNSAVDTRKGLSTFELIDVDSSTTALTKVNVNVAGNSIFEPSALANLTTFDGANSTGDIILGSGITGKLSSIRTGSGDDLASLSTTLNSQVKTASVDTAAGNDGIVVEVNGSAAVMGSVVTVNAGAGDDGMQIDLVAGPPTPVSFSNTPVKFAAPAVQFKVDAGAGDDIVQLNIADMVDIYSAFVHPVAGATNGEQEFVKSSFDGGAGSNDWLVIDSGSTALALGKTDAGEAATYALLNDSNSPIFKGFENLGFLSSGTQTSPLSVDASKLTKYQTLGFELQPDTPFRVNVSVSNAAANQTISLNNGTDALIQAAQPLPANVPGNLKIEVTASDYSAAAVTAASRLIKSDINASGANLELSVKAEGGEEAAGAAAAPVWLEASVTGNVRTATINLSSGIERNEVGNAAQNNFARSTLKTDGNLGLKDLSTVTLKGNGIAFIENGVGSKLSTINAADLDSTVGVDYTFGDLDVNLLYTNQAHRNFVKAIYEGGFKAGDKALGLVLESKNAAIAETVTLGDGIDLLNFTRGSTVLNTDKVIGLNLVLDGSGTKLSNQSDLLTVDVLARIGSGPTPFIGPFEKLSAADLESVGTAISFEQFLNRAANLAGKDALALQYGNSGSYYVFVDLNKNGSADQSDTLIEVSGQLTIDSLLVSLNSSPLSLV